jgi:RNA recognition motif. (a.k.a. RRM, RBD, or RNP domain)
VKHWLLVGNVPKGLSEEELQEIFNTNCPGVENIEFFKESFPSGLFGANISMSFR